jgi:hypothetical protein
MKITKLNYFQEYDKLGNDQITENFEKTHNMLSMLTQGGKDWTKVNGNKTFTEMADKQFQYLELLIRKRAGKSEASVPSQKVKSEPRLYKRSTQSEERPEKKVTHADTVKKVSRTVAKSIPGTPVETVDPHLIILSRYRRLDGKTVPRDKVAGLARTLIKQIEARILRKASPYAKLIEKMREHLFEVLDKSKGVNVRVSITDKSKAEIDKALFDEHQMKSVQLLRRYAGMAGKLTTVEKAKRLYNSMVNAVEKETIPQDDRYFERVIEIMRVLKKYIEREDERKQMPLLPAELSGVLGCDCEDDEAEGSLDGIDDEEPEVFDRDLEHEDSNTASQQPICSTDFMHKKFARYPIQEPWVKIFGQVEPGKHTIIFAKEKLGKTTAMVEFAGYLSRNHGSVLFVQKEEELSGTFQDKLEQTRASNPNLYLIEDLPSIENLREYKFVILDSVTRLTLSPSQLLSLQKRLGKDTTIFAIVHATKDGKHRGSNDYVHDAAHIVTFPEFGAAYGRGRFKGHTGELIRFTDPI